MLRPFPLAALLVAPLLALPAALRGQPAPAAWPKVRTTTANVRLDGRLDEPDWALADSITDFRTKEPTEGGTPSERTVVRLLATPQGLVVGWWLFDRDPAGRRRSQLRRDAELRSDDYVSLMVDGLRDKRSAFYFRVNSNGALWDGEHVTIESGNEEWDGIWDARTAVAEWGWSAEMLIPWATLRYPKDVTAMGMNFRRFLPRTNEEVLWRAWKRGQGYRFLEEEGTIEGFPALPPRARAELRPFVVGEGRLPEWSFDSTGAGTRTASASSALAAGLDVKVPVTNTLTADLTVLPDFAQAEVDRQVVNLSRFPLFFPEQRPFFTEGAAIFNFGRERQSQMFYSRRIGLGSGGTPVEIPFGARVQGRIGRDQLGLLAVRTGDLEQATDLVARVRHDVLGRGYIGAMATWSDRDAQPGALAGGADFEFPFILRGRENLIFQGNAAWSRDSAGAPAGAHYRFVVDYPNDKADVVMRYDRVDADYRPALGFVSQAGIHRLAGNVQLTPRPRDARVIRRWEFSLLNYNAVWDLQGRLDNATFSVRPLGFQLQSGDRWELNLQRGIDNPVADFEIVPDVTIAAGAYDWQRVEISYNGSNVRTWKVNANASAGGFYDGHGTTVSLSGQLRLQPHVELTLEAQRNDVSLSAGAFAATTLRFRGDYAVSPRLTATAFLQFDDQSDRAAVNARIRWTTSPGSDLYVVWNNTWQGGLPQGIPWERPLRGALVAKYVRFFRM
ncbi:MAG: carbohydrate binding family 9 domain-containing protein [Gemmatimonadaceae bacterium]|nr:carbohydrate binding family 9 domain-containing protein [Gemmatimonadaceae bacterium]